MKLIKSDQIMEIIQSNQIIELIKSNQLMGLIKLSQDIQSWHLDRCSMIIDVVTFNCDRQDTQSCLGISFDA